MAKFTETALLKDQDIITEINKYKWFESEKEGRDIGFERASREWINKYSKAYLTHRVNQTTMLWLKTSPILNLLNKEINLK
jgi:hypothetical protein